MAFIIFIIVMICIFTRPFNLPIWISSSIGALIFWLFGLVTLKDIAFVFNMIWDSTFTLVGLIILALCLESVGFFSYLARIVFKLSGADSRGNFYVLERVKFFIFMMIFGLFCTVFLANDGAILVLSPLVFAMFANNAESKTPLMIFLLCFGFLSDFGSNALNISNLTNIITAEFFNLSPLHFFKLLALPQLFAFIGAIFIFWLILGKKLPKTLHCPIILDKNLSNKEFIYCLILLLSLPLGSIICHRFNVPLCVFVGFIAICAFIFCLKKRAASVSILKKAPFSIVIFSLGLFIVVFGLANAGVLEALKKGIVLIDSASFASLLACAFGSGLGSGVINNLPMVMLGDLALNGIESSIKQYLIAAHLLGCNIGSKITPIGSLATLLWLFSIQRYGIFISFFSYMKLAFIFSVFVLFCSVVGLFVAMKFF